MKPLHGPTERSWQKEKGGKIPDPFLAPFFLTTKQAFHQP
jgi:hypothetical protein